MDKIVNESLNNSKDKIEEIKKSNVNTETPKKLN